MRAAATDVAPSSPLRHLLPEKARPLPLSTGYGRGESALLPQGEGGRRPDEGLRPLRQPARQAPSILSTRRTVTTKGVEPDCKIDRIAAKPAFRQQDGDFARDPSFACAGGVDHHARKARRQRQARDRAAFVGNAPIAVYRADVAQERQRLLERGARGRVEKSKLRGIGDAPEGAVERKTGEIGRQNLRRGVGLKSAVRRLLPQPIADARFNAPRAPASLIGVRPADADRLQSSEADVRLVDRNAHEPAVDDDAHAFES